MESENERANLSNYFPEVVNVECVAEAAGVHVRLQTTHALHRAVEALHLPDGRDRVDAIHPEEPKEKIQLSVGEDRAG